MARPRGARARAEQTVAALRDLYPDVRCALHHRDAYQLLVATILSAQCTDERVNMVTPELFRRYPSAADLAVARPDDVEELIRSTGFFRAKARSLIGMAQALEERFDGTVPSELDDLVTVPGVGRKTGNVVRSVAFDLPGLPVDTHVGRLARRLRLTAEHDPVKVERDLTGLVEPREWGNLSLRLIEHGRRTCVARRPRCKECALAPFCPSAGETAPAPAQRAAPSSSRATRSKERRAASSARSTE